MLSLAQQILPWALPVLGVVLLLLFLLLPGRSSPAQRKPFTRLNVAHRGLHTGSAEIPENSLAAFAAAAAAGYGIELDVQLSLDGAVVVFHDDDLARVCGEDAPVGSKTLEELRRLRLLDSDQSIPTLAEVLALVNGRSPLVVELKSGPRNRELCEKTWEFLQAYSGLFCIESFDPRIVGWFRRNAPQVLRGQLSALPRKLNKGFFGILLSNLLGNFYARPQFVAYNADGKTLLARVGSLGTMRIVWTVCSRQQADALQPKNDMVIFEGYRPPVRY